MNQKKISGLGFLGFRALGFWVLGFGALGFWGFGVWGFGGSGALGHVVGTSSPFIQTFCHVRAPGKSAQTN